MKYLAPYIFTLFYWAVLYSLTTVPAITLYAFIFFIVLFIVFAFMIGGRRRQWNFWFSNFLFLVSSFGFVLIIASPLVRNAYIAAFGILAGLMWYVAIRYFEHAEGFLAHTYLHFIGFIYLITFWQMTALLYFMLLSYETPFWAPGLIVLVYTFILGRGIILAHGLKKSSETLVLTVLTLTSFEIFYFVRLLPLHYYVLATLVASWYFFIIEMVLSGQEISSRRKMFKVYTSIFIAVVAVLLLTASWE